MLGCILETELTGLPINRMQVRERKKLVMLLTWITRCKVVSFTNQRRLGMEQRRVGNEGLSFGHVKL